jgi:hypothetical protein
MSKARLYNPDGYDLSLLTWFELIFFDDEIDDDGGGEPLRFMKEYNAMPGQRIVAWAFQYLRRDNKYRIRFWLWTPL